jgi:hypothetical protein
MQLQEHYKLSKYGLSLTHKGNWRAIYVDKCLANQGKSSKSVEWEFLHQVVPLQLFHMQFLFSLIVGSNHQLFVDNAKIYEYASLPMQ